MLVSIPFLTPPILLCYYTDTFNRRPVIYRIQNDTITRGSNFTVNCTAVSSAHNHVQWYKGFCYDDCSNKTSFDNVELMKVFHGVEILVPLENKIVVVNKITLNRSSSY